MIKVIEEKPVSRDTIKCTCCGSILEYGNADLSEDYSCLRDVATAYQTTQFKHYKLRCPVCGVEQPAYWIYQN